MIEFTGERVVPGQVDADLWNEHIARYEFAARLAPGRRVLDAGCGSGYGTAELARTAQTVFSLDVALDAVRYARQSYGAPNIRFLQASCGRLPLADASIDLAVTFEVIEHIHEWKDFLAELRRVLAPTGTLIISTPNKDYYSDTRRETGPNPYHVHEFEFGEFAAELHSLFPHTTLYLQNHVDGIAFQPVEPTPQTPELRHARRLPDTAAAHFYLAVCTIEPKDPPAPFFYVPSTANVLHEREIHIHKLEADVERLRTEKQDVVDKIRAQTAELEKSNRWAGELDHTLAAARARIVELQDEVAQKVAGYEAKITSLEAEDRAKTAWAQGLDAEVAALKTKLDHVRASRWVQLGNRAGLGPKIDQ